MRYVALIQRRTEFGNRYYMISSYGESRDHFVERVRNCYVLPYETPYYDIEIYALGEEISL